MLKIIKNMMIPIIAIAMILSPKIIINAQSEIDTIQTGSIKITLEEVKNGSNKGVVFDLYKVANFKGGILELTGDFKNTNIDLNNIKTANELEKASQVLSQVDTTSNQTRMTDENGILIFKDLEVGAYLIKPTNTVNYDEISPVVISIPTFNEVNGEMIYDIECYPKHSPRPEMPPTGDDSKYKIAGILLISTGMILLFISLKKKRQDTKSLVFF